MKELLKVTLSYTTSVEFILKVPLGTADLDREWIKDHCPRGLDWRDSDTQVLLEDSTIDEVCSLPEVTYER